MQTALISLPQSWLARISEVASIEKISLEDALKKILDNYFNLLEINQLRLKLAGKAEAAGFFSEEEIYEAIS